MTTITTSATTHHHDLDCDYLVVGAGAASIAFIDTLLTEMPDAKIVVLDKKAVPGGHWVDAYGYVKLHQPSLLYGVASRQLEGNWLKLLLAKRMLPWKHRASKKELLQYYAKFIQDKEHSGQLQFFPNCEYIWNQQDQPQSDENVYYFSSNDGSTKYTVHVRAKLVNGILGECKIPSLCPVEFPVDHGVPVVTPNQIFDTTIHKSLDKSKTYVVLGMGKTAMDAVVYLQRTAKVAPRNIRWVIPNDVWMLNRNGTGSPWSWPQALLEHDGDEQAAAHALEQEGAFLRLDPTKEPTRFRFPVVGPDELALMRQVPQENLIRKGRVTAIRRDSESNDLTVEFGTDHEPWTIPQTSSDATVFVHCTSPGPFNGIDTPDLFASDTQLNLSLIYAPPVPISMSCLAYLESARVKSSLDMDFGRRLVQAKLYGTKPGDMPEQAPIPENEVLRNLIQCMPLDKSNDPTVPFRSMITLACFMALASQDDTPMGAYDWLGKNRLSFFSVPGFKCQVYEQLGMLVERGERLGFSDGEIQMLDLLRERMSVLEGK